MRTRYIINCVACPVYGKRKANWIGHILRRNCLLQRVIEGKIIGGIEVTGRRGRKRRTLLDDLKERRGYSHLKEEALDRTMWRARFGRGFGPVVRQTTKWMNESGIQYVPTLSNKGTIFEKKNLLNIKCVFWFSLQLSSEILLILRRNEHGRSKMYIGFHVTYILFLSDFNETWIFSTYFRKILKYQISWKSVVWEPSCSIRTNGHTWRS
jgi:hypothetical protein